MKSIGIFDQKDYDPSWDKIKRIAVRAIIIKDNKIALVKSTKEGFYKFPGGGINESETEIAALIRETKEEVGLNIIKDSIKEFGYTLEIRKCLFESEKIFHQMSLYFMASISDEVFKQDLDEYEIELGYVLEWVDLKKAYEINMALKDIYKSDFLFREASVLKILMDK